VFTYKKRIEHWLKEFFKVLRVVMRNKRGALGIFILTFFIFVAIAAPLIAPYEPLAIPTDLIASPLALPSWIRYLPGYGNLSENLKNGNFHQTYQAIQLLPNIHTWKEVQVVVQAALP
jgi:ABC-type antimicrobial peptide transport system permease subunit